MLEPPLFYALFASRDNPDGESKSDDSMAFVLFILFIVVNDSFRCNLGVHEGHVYCPL